MPDEVLVRLNHTFSFPAVEDCTAQVFTTMRLSKSGRGGMLARLCTYSLETCLHMVVGGGTCLHVYNTKTYFRDW